MIIGLLKNKIPLKLWKKYSHWKMKQLKKKNENVKKPFILKKKKLFFKIDLKGKPVFLEDTGEKLGIIFDIIYVKDNNFVIYKVKDKKSDAVLSFPSDQFETHKDGVIFVPGWFNNALKIIEKLEFKDKISPELTLLLSDDAVSNEELYKIFIKHDDEMAKYIDDARFIHKILNCRIRVLEKQRIGLKDVLMDLTEKRLIKDIDRRHFSEDVMNHRRKAKILDININKCKGIINRIVKTSFGILIKNNYLYNNDSHIKEIKIEKKMYERVLDSKENIPNIEANTKRNIEVNLIGRNILH